MGWRAWLKCLVGVALALSVVIEVRAKQPVFVSWLVADDPGDQTILHYWERYELEELSPTEMVDLGSKKSWSPILATFQANSRSASCSSVGASFVTTFRSSAVICPLSLSCTR